MDDALNLINNIPIILKYCIPGAISLRLFMFLYRKENSDSKYFIFKSIIISGLIVYPLETIYNKWTDFQLFVFALFLGVFFAVIVSKILNGNKIQDWLQLIHIRKTTRCFWDDAIDLNKGSYAEVRIKGDSNLYYGTVEYLEDKEEGDIYMSIVDYSIRTAEQHTIIQDKGVRLIFNTSNVSSIVIKSGGE